ncbi:prolipoprotein diacylglyceryl transferase [Leptolyngbya cf. ectocarpi LEGE 11479]|uniref:Phosphatidylglycerol--prolipoprotein diacylglyceryl transferase n=1 Tax=Leptolyngbya cf. ectocarpi LEGE 11479 TaxID=1828722 RepID=A0A928ZU60_LEPEC|nr:prolipoprotein diacylglyceryl transferase [Leptolyngbya ectocarpi]MBE9067513.1 prolipoprotein diacylglyceryl transferase [Leptolyngbya cf. ectocarpi LEGE 11479]
MYPPVDPTIVEFGPFALRWYGLLMATAVITGSWFATKEIERRGKNPEDFWDMLIWVLIPAFIGARLYYVFVQSSDTAYYLQNPGQILQIWGGGIHIFGAFIFGGIALWLFTKIRRLPTLLYLDAAAVGLPIAQAIGRWGNFINQELYGPPTNWPFGLQIDPRHRLVPYNDLTAYPESTRFHALFLYESVWNFLGFFVLYWVSKRFGRQLRPGDLSLLYLVWYPFGRFFIEFLRTDSWFFPGTPFNVVHILSLVAVVGAIATLVLRRRLGPVANSNS